MPRKTGRTKALQHILVRSTIDIIWSKSDGDVDTALANCSEQVLCVFNHRYLGPRTTKIPKSDEWYVNILPEYDDLRFKSCLRVTREDFSNLLEIISPSTVFQCTRKKMTPIDKQLAIALYRFGCEGTGVSFLKIGQKFGVSDGGLIRESTDRVIKALLEHEKDVIKWPGVGERHEIQSFMADKLPGCVGYIDGCHIPLFHAPVDHHESYFSRKQQYAIQLQAVCDNDLIIRNITVGYPASAHDARVFANSPVGMFPERFLEPGQWIAGDSAYKLTETIITPFRDNSTVGTSQQRKNFNRHFSSFRVKIEHTFGILKKVFGSLRGLRVLVDRDTGHRRACDWIRACCVVYNIIKPIFEMQDFQEDDDNEINLDTNSPIGEQRRRQLFNWINGI